MLGLKLYHLKIPVSRTYKRTLCSVSPILTKVDFRNNVKEITMCHEKTRNSLSISMMSNLIEHIKHNECDKQLRLIVISAQGPVFSAGHNLKELAEGQKTQQQVFQKCAELMSAIIDSPVPVIAKIDGVAAAAGCQLAAQCDIVICSDKSTFSTPGGNFGIFCSTPGVALARSVNQKTAFHMLLTGFPITAQEAQSARLVSKVCPSEELDKELEIISEAIKAKSRDVIALGKKFFYQQIQEKDVKKAYVLGGSTMVENCQLPDAKEGMTSFREKRKPKWT